MLYNKRKRIQIHLALTTACNNLDRFLLFHHIYHPLINISFYLILR